MDRKNFLKIFGLSLAVVVLATLTVLLPKRVVTTKKAAFGTVNVLLEPKALSLSVGEEKTINIYLDNPTNKKISFVDLKLAFNKAILEITKFESDQTNFPNNLTGTDPGLLGKETGRANLQALNIGASLANYSSILFGTITIKGKAEGVSAMTIAKDSSQIVGENIGELDKILAIGTTQDGSYTVTPAGGVTPTPTQPAASLKIFTTSQEYTGNLGGLAGADAKCQALASAAGLTGTFKAWLSDSNTNAKDRFMTQNLPYYRTDNVIVANSLADLIDGSLSSSISKDQQGTTIPSGGGTYNVFTGTDRYGVKKNGYVCNDWTSSLEEDSCSLGSSMYTDYQWTEGNEATSICSFPFRLFCLEDTPPVPPEVTVTPTATATPLPNQPVLNFSIKFQGVNQERADQKVKVRVVKGALDKSFTDINVIAGSAGIYSGGVTLNGVTAGSGYKIFIKGPKHLAKKFCSDNQDSRCPGEGNITLVAGENNFDFSKEVLEAGDVPDPNNGGRQNGVVNSVDYSLIQNRMGKGSPADLAVADLNFDDAVNSSDVVLARNTLETKYEDDY